jgi:hypothetical protein
MIDISRFLSSRLLIVSSQRVQSLNNHTTMQNNCMWKHSRLSPKHCQGTAVRLNFGLMLLPLCFTHKSDGVGNGNRDRDSRTQPHPSRDQSLWRVSHAANIFHRPRWNSYQYLPEGSFSTLYRVQPLLIWLPGRQQHLVVLVVARLN